MITYGE